MIPKSSQRLTCVPLFLLFFFIGLVSSQDCYSNRWYIIRSLTTGLAVDAREPSSVKLHNFDGSIYQQWQFQCGSKVGFFYIVNRATGYALTNSDSGYIIVSPQISADLSQHWTVNSDGCVSGWTAGNLGAESDILIDGGVLIGSGDRDAALSQQFTVQENF